jgi:hypothetical protein
MDSDRSSTTKIKSVPSCSDISEAVADESDVNQESPSKKNTPEQSPSKSSVDEPGIIVMPVSHIPVVMNPRFDFVPFKSTMKDTHKIDVT